MSIENSNQILPVMESFFSIQGEGHHNGTAAWFVRLGGCDIECPWCDVKESWDADAHDRFTVDQICEQAVQSGAEIAIITGGEPLMHKLDELTEALQNKGIKTHLETSGVHPISGSWDWICFSPKKFKKPLENIYTIADELKVIVFNRTDFAWAEKHESKLKKKAKLFLQAEWDKRDGNIPMILNYIRDNQQWRISVQIHKYLGVE